MDERILRLTVSLGSILGILIRLPMRSLLKVGVLYSSSSSVWNFNN